MGINSDISTADNDVRYVPTDAGFGFCGLAHESRYNWVLENWDLQAKAVLDFGCGSGYGSHLLSSRASRVDALDYSEATIILARARYQASNLSFVRMDATSPAVLDVFKASSYDVVVSFDVIEHVERYFDFLGNIHQLLKEDGTLIIGCPNRLQVFSWNRHWNPYHFQEFSPYQLRTLLRLYFREVVLVSQRLSDEAREEFEKKRSYGPATMLIKAGVKELLPASLTESLRTGLRGFRAARQMVRVIAAAAKGGGRTKGLEAGSPKGFEYSDVAFEVEPGEDRLGRANGLVAICRGKKTVLEECLLTHRHNAGSFQPKAEGSESVEEWAAEPSIADSTDPQGQH